MARSREVRKLDQNRATSSTDGGVMVRLGSSPATGSGPVVCDSCLVNGPRCPAQPLTPALPLSIKPYAMCSPMLLIRLPRDFRRSLGNVHQ